MIQTDTLNMSKLIAKIPLGPGARDSFTYWSDLKKQWENSHNTSKIVELIGSQSMPAHNLPDVEKWLGKLSNSEQDFSKKFESFYRDLVKLLTSVEVPVASEYDLAETLLDRRILDEHIKFPCRILDIGPGVARHLVNVFLSPERRGSVYVGVESIGLPYSLQNAVASHITLRDRDARFFEYIDYEFARRDFPKIEDLPPNSIVHLPLWQAARLPEKYFDLIICSYVLDEVPADDFLRIADIVGRCLADDGVAYCRGSQQRGMIKDMYLYGYGTFHGQDITKTLLSKGLGVTMCETIASQLTRFFVRESSGRQAAAGGKYADINNDIPLMEALQNDFVAANLKELAQSKKKVLVWGDYGYADYLKYIAPHQEGLNIIGLTNRALAARVSPATTSGVKEYWRYLAPYVNRFNIRGFIFRLNSNGG